MSSSWGRSIKYAIFGESHGEGIGIIIDGLPAGLQLDMEFIEAEMRRRKPGNSPFTTARQEPDSLEFLSGVFNQKTTGAPLCAFIRNINQHSKDYDAVKNLMRPGHADYTAYVKYHGFNDYRGGGHFSGRLTAPMVFAGAIAKQLLVKQGIKLYSHIYNIGKIQDTSFLDINLTDSTLSQLYEMPLPVMNSTALAEMSMEIHNAKAAGDSIGGSIEVAACDMPGGLGDPFFDSLESTIAHLVFSIPGVKGIEFGTGFAMTELRGSQCNDQYYVNSGAVSTYTNHCGGILGGISNGMPLIFRAAFKPTASIAKEQSTINIETMENTSIKVTGRHDPCIVPRAVAVVEASAAIAILDALF